MINEEIQIEYLELLTKAKYFYRQVKLLEEKCFFIYQDGKFLSRKPKKIEKPVIKQRKIKVIKNKDRKWGTNRNFDKIHQGPEILSASGLYKRSSLSYKDMMDGEDEVPF